MPDASVKNKEKGGTFCNWKYSHTLPKAESNLPEPNILTSIITCYITLSKTISDPNNMLIKGCIFRRPGFFLLFKNWILHPL